jgi:quercetin dioxygenase-like cupin family protein
MKVGKLSNHDRGWIIGDFENSLLRTSEFEVCVRVHPKGEVWPAHTHKIATEYNILISGSMSMCGIELTAGDTFIVEPNEVADPIFHEDCTIVCVKTPSIPTDKYIV